MKVITLWLSFGLLITKVFTDSHPSACMSDLTSQSCLDDVKQVLASHTEFWFGTGFPAKCPSGQFPLTSTCINKDRNHTSILTRMRQNDDNTADVIQQVLNVTFDAPIGTYEACGKTYQVPAVQRTVDPTRITDIPLWSADHLPEVRWVAKPNKTYTLIVWDAGSLILHAMFYNIRGGSLQDAQTGRVYNGPKNNAERGQPYPFLLYEQPTPQLDAEQVKQLAQSVSTTNLASPSLLSQPLGLIGPVGVSILTVVTDPYSAWFMKLRKINNKCPGMLTPKFQQLSLPVNVSSISLMSSVDVTYTVNDFSFKSCCKDYNIRRANRSLNPMEDGSLEPVFTGSKPHVDLVHGGLLFIPYFTTKQMTLIMLEMTDHIEQSPNHDVTLLWQVVNILQGNVTTGETTHTYLAPQPMGAGPSMVLFLLLQQSAMLNATTLTSFTTKPCPQHLQQRCGFNLTAFLKDLELTIDGATWFMTSPDAYSRHQAVLSGLQTETQACDGVSGYEDPCPVGGSKVIAINRSLILSCVVLVVLLLRDLSFN